MSTQSLPRGVASVHVLPAGHHDGPWDSIVVPDGTRERLLGTALVAMMHGRRLAALPAPPSGLIVLAGPPGTGKTTLGRGLAQAAALAVAARGATTFLEIDPHAMPSEMLGESQRNVTRLLRDIVPELAASRPHVVVLIDEVESFAVRRDLASFETNPVDVQRATDAVLAGLDHLAAAVPGAVVVTTTNFVSAVDEAFLSRADLVVELALPDAAARARIIAAALTDLAVAWPELKDLADDGALHDELAARTDGLGRAAAAQAAARGDRGRPGAGPRPLAADAGRAARGGNRRASLLGCRWQASLAGRPRATEARKANAYGNSGAAAARGERMECQGTVRGLGGRPPRGQRPPGGGSRGPDDRRRGTAPGRRAHVGADPHRPDGEHHARHRRPSWLPVRRSWRLNERHYGALQGKDKAQVREQYGDEQYMRWRRSYDVPPPPISDDDPLSAARDPRYAGLPPELLPRTECLRDVVHRLLPYWYDAIVPDLAAGRTVLVVAHGNPCAPWSSTWTGSATRQSPSSTSRPASRWCTSSTRPSRPSRRAARYLDPEAAAVAAEAVKNQGR